MRWRNLVIPTNIFLTKALSKTAEKKSAQQKFATATHCIFDVDGTLLNSETIYARTYEDYLNNFGHHYTPDLHKKILGSSNQNAWNIIKAELKLKIPAEILAVEFRKLVYDRLENIPLLPGVEKLLRHLHKHEIPLAIATSAADIMYARKIEKHRELFEVFHHVVCGGTDPEVKRGKPAPDVFTICARRFENEARPGECLVFEDAPNGVAAAIAAGMQCVVVPDKDVPADAYKCATLVLNSLEDFVPEQFGLPPYVA